MQINKNIISDLIELQIEYKIQENKLLIFALTIANQTITALQTIISKVSITDEEIILFTDILIQNELFTKKDLEFLQKLKSVKINDKNYDNEVIQILNHLSFIVGRKFRNSKKTKIRVINLLKQNVSIDDFKKVHLYFAKLWLNNPEFNKFLRPDTLYNNKFFTRLEESELFLNRFNKYKKDILFIVNHFRDLLSINNISNQNVQLLTNNVDIYSIPLDIQESLIHWLERGYNINDIQTTITLTIDNWSKKPELTPYISLSKILDNKFPERYNIVCRKLQVTQQKNKIIQDWLKN